MLDKKLKVVQLALREMIELYKKMEADILQYDMINPDYYNTVIEAEKALKLSLQTPEDYLQENQRAINHKCESSQVVKKDETPSILELVMKQNEENRKRMIKAREERNKIAKLNYNLKGK